MGAGIAELPPIELPPVTDGEFDQAPDGSHGWSDALVRLPSRHFMLETDLGLKPGERAELVETLKTGTPEEKMAARKRVDFLLEVFVELMHRTRMNRPKVDQYGNPLYRDREGKETSDRFIIEYAPDTTGGQIKGENAAIMVNRSEFGVDVMDARTGPGSKIMTPGHVMKEVRNDWLDLLPRLSFKNRDEVFSPTYYRNEAAIKDAQQRHKAHLDDGSPERRALMKWLEPFKQLGKPSAWDGVA